jgi:uncharacterized repeat protein (TIGR01451 family)
VATSTTAGSNCPPGGQDPACALTVEVFLPGLTISTTADVTTATPGDVVRFSTSLVNTGPVPNLGVRVTVDVTDIVDDAPLNPDQVASSGVLTRSGEELTWTGDIPINGTVTISGTVTVDDPDAGNRLLVATVMSGSSGANCPPGGSDPACTAGVAVLQPGLTITKTADTAEIVTGGTVTYTMALVNTGQSPYADASVTDRLAGVLDDAAYNNDVTSTAGAVLRSGSSLSWVGDLAVGGTAAITYSVTTVDPITGDGRLVNTVVSAAAGNNCSSGSRDARCGTDTPVAATAIVLSSLPADATIEAGTGEWAGAVGLVTMMVTTNSRTGYMVTVQSEGSDLIGAQPGNSDTIPIENLRVRETGTRDAFQPLSSDNDVIVHRQSAPSTAGGDAISTDYQVDVPFVVSDTYSATVEYVAIAQ